MTTNALASELGATLLSLPTPVVASQSKRSRRPEAVEAWVQLLGPQRAQFDDPIREDYAKCTLPQKTKPCGVLRPRHASEVQEVVRIANRYGIAWHAISRGKNWGYGDACAATDDQVIIDLREMNQIREVNVELGYAVIEPGVSQGQMHEYLRDNNLPLLLDVTGAGPDASIVGNILQRGFGHTPYGDRFRHTCGFEVVLPDGRLINTGFGASGESEVSRVFPWGAGPWIDGLFTQSNLGVVTSACIWLMPKPEVIEGFALKLNDESKLGELIDGLRILRMAGVVRSTVHVANDLRVLSSRMSRPTEGVASDAPLSEAIRSQLRRQSGVGCWNLLGALYGSEREVRAQRRLVKQTLGSVASVRFFRRRTIDLARRAGNLARRLGVGSSFSGAG